MAEPLTPGDWVRVPTVAPGGHHQQHVMPAVDIRPHRVSETCHCEPVEDDEAPDMWLHNAFDGREDYETGRRRMH